MQLRCAAHTGLKPSIPIDIRGSLAARRPVASASGTIHNSSGPILTIVRSIAMAASAGRRMRSGGRYKIGMQRRTFYAAPGSRGGMASATFCRCRQIGRVAGRFALDTGTCVGTAMTSRALCCPGMIEFSCPRPKALVARAAGGRYRQTCQYPVNRTGRRRNIGVFRQVISAMAILAGGWRACMVIVGAKETVVTVMARLAIAGEIYRGHAHRQVA